MMNTIELLKLLDALDKEYGYYEEIENEPLTPNRLMVSVAKDLHEEHMQGWM